MPGAFDAAQNTALQVGQTIQTAKTLLDQKQRIIEDQQREMAEVRASRPPVYSSSSSDYDYAVAAGLLSKTKTELLTAERELRTSQRVLAETQNQLKQTKIELVKTKTDLGTLAVSKKESDDLLLEWMQGNEAFKTLTKKFGKKLGMTDDEIKIEISEAIIGVAEEDTQFSNTKMTDRARKRIDK